VTQQLCTRHDGATRRETTYKRASTDRSKSEAKNEMKIELFLLLPLYRANDEFIFDRTNGIVFRREDPVFTFDSEVPRIIDIMIASPRLQFREAFQADCGDLSEGLDKMPKNFFNIDDSLPDLQEPRLSEL
jgi:hypothetical protein